MPHTSLSRFVIISPLTVKGRDVGQAKNKKPSPHGEGRTALAVDRDSAGFLTM